MVNFDQVVDFTDKYVLNPKYSLVINLFFAAQLDRQFLKNSTGAINFIRNLLGEWRRVRSQYKKLSLFMYLLLWKRIHNTLTYKIIQRSEANKIAWRREIVVITGGGDGMGAALADMLARRGAKVAILDVTDTPKYKSAAPKLFKCDVSSEESVKSAAAAVREEFGAPTMLVNAAGILRTGPLSTGTTDKEYKMIAINLLGSMYTIRAFVPDMIKRNKGHILQFASGAGFATLPLLGGYCASKAGVVAMFEALQLELEIYHKTTKVRTTLISPLKVQTALGAAMHDANNQFMSPTLNREDVAKRVLLALESDQNHYLMTPYLANVTPWLRVMPRWLSRKVIDNTKFSFFTEEDYVAAGIPKKDRKY